MDTLKAAVFDMDGLMFDTERLCMDAWKHIGKELGITVNDQVFAACIGRNNADTRLIVMEHCGPDFPYDVFYARVRDWLHSYMDTYGTPEKPGLRELLDFLLNRRIPAALATSTSRESASWMIQRAGLTRYFSAYAFGNEVEHGKPAPDIFLHAAHSLGNIAGAGCVVFEDSPAGLSAAAAAGMKSVFVKDLVEPSPQILASVWRRFDRLDEAIPALTALLDTQTS